MSLYVRYSSPLASGGGGNGVASLAPVGSAPNANGGLIAGSVLTLEPANTSFPGVLTAADWNTFNNKLDNASLYCATYSDISSTSLPTVTGVQSGTTLYADYALSINANYAGGSATGTAHGAAAISGGRLDLSGSVNAYVSYSPASNVSNSQVGTIRLNFAPNYSGSPASTQNLFNINNGSGSLVNLFACQHTSGGDIALYVFDSGGSPISSGTVGAFSPTMGQSYELEIDYNLTSGDIYVFIDGALLSHITGAIGVRNATLSGLFFCVFSTGGGTSNFFVTGIAAFSSVQHVAPYSSPSASPIMTYSPDGTTVITGDTVLFSNLTTLADRGVYEATVGVSIISWARQVFGRDVVGIPEQGDEVLILSGTSRGGNIAVCTSTALDTFEFFDPDGVLSVASVGSSPNNAGASIASNILTLQPADSTHPGVLTAGAQSIGGAKTFTGAISASNLSGTNTGNVTIGTASGLSLVGQALSLGLASAGVTGALSGADWSTFNNKQSALTIGNLTDAGTDGIVVTGGTGSIIGSGVSIAQHVADSTHNGYLSSTDWSTFNNKQAAGTYVTSLTIASANGFAGSSSGGATPALTLSTSITGILQGNGTAISAASTTGSGAIVLATNAVLVTPALGTPSALVGTNITGTASGLTAGNVTTNANMTGDVTSVGNATTLATVNSNVGAFTNANITVNAKGLITAASNGSAAAAIRSSLIVQQGNGYGSSNVSVRRYNTAQITITGSDLSYTDSATAGMKFNCLTTGLYAVTVTDAFNGASRIGITKNGTQGGTSIQSITDGSVLAAAGNIGTANFGSYVAWTGLLTAGDFLWIQTDQNTPTDTLNKNVIYIVKIGT